MSNLNISKKATLCASCSRASSSATFSVASLKTYSVFPFWSHLKRSAIPLTFWQKFKNTATLIATVTKVKIMILSGGKLFDPTSTKTCSVWTRKATASVTSQWHCAREQRTYPVLFTVKEFVLRLAMHLGTQKDGRRTLEKRGWLKMERMDKD